MYFQNKNIYMIGIGGIGMSGLAMFLKLSNLQVQGSNYPNNKQVKKLQSNGLEIEIGHNQKLSENTDIVIYSEAIDKESNQQFLEAKARNLETLTYREALGKLTQDYKLIAISGTHGKTTTTSLLIQALLANKIDISCIVGTNLSILNNWNYRKGTSQYFILEACELNQGFMNLNPEILAITNIELDHIESFQNLEQYIQTFQELADKTQEKVFINAQDTNSQKITINNQKKEEFNNSNLPQLEHLIGDFNRVNADCAVKIADYLGLEHPTSLQAVKEFQGIEKRMEHITDNIYADYGHHPTAIQATLKAIKEKYPNKSLCLIYQPHQYSRTIKLIQQFQNCFQKADKVIISDIYECRDTQEDIQAMDVDQFIQVNQHSNMENAQGLDNCKNRLAELSKNYDIVVIMGAGDISRLYDDLK